MKKVLYGLVATIALTALVACNSDNSSSNDESPAAAPVAVEQAPAAMPESDDTAVADMPESDDDAVAGDTPAEDATAQEAMYHSHKSDSATIVIS